MATSRGSVRTKSVVKVEKRVRFENEKFYMLEAPGRVQVALKVSHG